MIRTVSCLVPLLGLLACASPPPAPQAPPPVPPSAAEAPVVPAPRSQPAAPATTPPQPGAAPGTSAPSVPSTPPRTSAPAPSVAEAPKAAPKADAAAPKKAPPVVAAAKPATPGKPPAVPAATPPPAAPPAPAAQATLDLKTLERRLKDTPAIGVMTKLSIKNQVDDLVDRFRDYYEGRLRASLADLRRPYDLLVMKVMTLLQEGDPELARAVHASREAIWAMLADREKFARLTA